MTSMEFLKQVPIFAHLTPEQLGPITAKLLRRRFQRGEVIFHEDDPGDRMHIIVEGGVKISVTSEDGREKNLALFKPGECFGEMSLLDGSNRSATATKSMLLSRVMGELVEGFGFGRRRRSSSALTMGWAKSHTLSSSFLGSPQFSRMVFITVRWLLISRPSTFSSSSD